MNFTTPPVTIPGLHPAATPPVTAPPHWSAPTASGPKLKIIEWVLRLAVFGEFLGHGIFAVQGKDQWVGWIQQFTQADYTTAATLLTLVGLLDLAVAAFVILKPIRLVLLWATFWGFWTALMRPLVGEPIWDFVERWANWGAPLALLMLRGWPKGFKEWLR